MFGRSIRVDFVKTPQSEPEGKSKTDIAYDAAEIALNVVRYVGVGLTVVICTCKVVDMTTNIVTHIVETKVK